MQLTPIGGQEPAPNLAIHALPLHEAAIGGMATLGDLVSVVSGAADGVVLRWSLETGEVLERLEGHRAAVNAVVRRGDWVASASDDGAVRVWRSGASGGPGAELDLQHVLNEHTHAVRDVAISDRHLVSVGEDAVVRVHDLQSGKLVHDMAGHRRPIRTVAIHPSGRYAVTASLDHAVLVWDLETGEPVEPLYDADGDVTELQAAGLFLARPNRTGRGHVGQAPRVLRFLPDGHLLSGSDGLLLWDFEGRSEARRLHGLAWSVDALAMDDERLFLGTHTEVRGVLRDQWDRVVMRWAPPSQGTGALALSGDRLAVGARDGSVHVLDVSRWSGTCRTRCTRRSRRGATWPPRWTTTTWCASGACRRARRAPCSMPHRSPRASRSRSRRTARWWPPPGAMARPRSRCTTTTGGRQARWTTWMRAASPSRSTACASPGTA